MFVVGHSADPWDPQSIRASMGAVFTVPVVAAASPQLVDALRGDVRIVGLSPGSPKALSDVDLTGPTMLVVGNERSGLSFAWRARCHEVAAIQTPGEFDSLNAAVAGSIALYEAQRQRSLVPRASS